MTRVTCHWAHAGAEAVPQTPLREWPVKEGEEERLCRGVEDNGQSL